MALITCHECQKEISSEAQTCPHCGAKNKTPASSGISAWVILIPIIIVILFIAMMAANDNPESKEKSELRRGIEFCWESYEKKSLTPGEKRFIASSCEMLEDKFTKTYGHKP